MKQHFKHLSCISYLVNAEASEYQTLAYQTLIRQSMDKPETHVAPQAIIGVAGLYNLPFLRDMEPMPPICQQFLLAAFGTDETLWRDVTPARYSDFETLWPSGKLAVMAYCEDDEFPELANNVELIVSSPLRRTIQTALLAFPSKLKSGMQVLAWSEVQEASDLICDTGSHLPDVKARFYGLPVDFSLVEPDWHLKQGKWAPTAACLLERAELARQRLSERPEAEIVVISHGCFLHFLTDDWINAINPQATDWANAEVRSFTLASDMSGGWSFDETEESRMRRGCNQLALTKEQQLELRDTVLKTWIE
ncbi:histidine phosphatase superfamily, clade-1 [Fusarium bulbicola]|nr:histidine phosphatase superfamily, clade-1 [Fusarium bulbicola]